MNIIETNDLVKKYGENIAVDSINLSINKGEIYGLLGPNGAGKSTIINKIIPELKLRTNGLSNKIDRGKHTTRHSEIYISNGIKLVDTPGFSMLDLFDIEPNELYEYYPDFEDFSDSCVYNNCAHIKTNSKECGVVLAVEKHQLSEERYDRYCLLYNNVLEKWRKKYD